MESEKEVLLKFLLGETSYRGKWFMEPEDNKSFWWRTELRRLFIEGEKPLGDQAEKWISVETKLPDDGVTVLCAVGLSDQTVEVGMYMCGDDYANGFAFLTSDDDGSYWSNVTHWQPLPTTSNFDPLKK